MDFTELAERRYSVRKFSHRPVESEKIDTILKTARLAPTACNNQPQRLLVIQSEEALTKLKKCTPYHFDAPLAILVCYNRKESWKSRFDGHDSGDIDSSIVGTHIMMTAADIGLGSTWVMYFDPAIMREEFNIPEEIIPVALFPIGYPADDCEPSQGHFSRKPIEETTFYDGFDA